MLVSWTPVLISLLLCLEPTRAFLGQSKDVFLRDPDGQPASPLPGNTASLTSSANAVESTHAGSTGQTNSTATASSHVVGTLTTSTISATGAATSTLAVNASAEILSIDDGSLPLPPEITPALALTGAFLMLSGVVYTLIGIRNKTVQIFISTAYLIALAITVLLVYVIVPPISNAIQGAYFVAAFVPAVGLGGVSLIFKDVTEGLGSAAGGFALSMWFLTLKPGGTLTSTVGKAVFIGCWTAGIYIIYFSHHVRSYVIIGATSFAGATAVILGIDCFSLAGLKEFWVYIWALNGKLFPPKEDTYPITRGMTVEIAGIVIFAFFGVLSQLRIWKIVQKRREAKDLEKSDEEHQRNEEEAELGRQVEAGQVQERRQWERMYGDQKGVKKKKDSVISTEARSNEESSASIGSNELGEGEMAEALPAHTNPSTTPGSGSSSVDGEHNERQIIVPVATDDITPAITDDSQGHSPYWTNPTTSAATSVSSVHRDKTNLKPVAKAKGPKVVPLPFTIPQSAEEQEEEEVNQGSDSSLQNTQHNSEANLGQPAHYLPPEIPLNLPKRFSVLTSTSLEPQVDDFLHDPQLSPYLAEFPTEENSESSSPEYEALTDRNEEAGEHIEAGVSGNPVVKGNLGLEASSQVDSLTQESDKLVLPASEVASLSGVSPNAEENTIEEPPNQHWPIQSETKPRAGSELATAHTSDVPEQDVHQAAPSDGAVELASAAKPEASGEISNDEVNQKPSGSLLQRVLSKDKASKVVMQFRTNEWAKHLAAAEKPTLDELAPVLPIVEEPTSMVNEEELLKTALTAEPAPADLPLREPPVVSPPKRTSRRSKRHSGQAAGQSSRDSVQRPHEVLRSVSASSRVGSKRPPVRSPFQTSRNSLLASPITEDVVASFPSQSPQAAKGTSQSASHGMARRSFTDPSPRPAPYLPYSSASPQMVSPNGDIAAALSNENLPLSQRRSYLRQSSSESLVNAPAPSPQAGTRGAPAKSSPSYPFPAQHARLEEVQQQIIPEHTLQRAQLLAEWRRSKAMETQSPPQRNSSASPMNVNSVSYSIPADQNIQMSGRQSTQGPRGSWNRLGGTGMSSPPPNAGIGQGMVDSTIYSGRNRLSRRTSGMSAKEVDNAHREVLRRMQAGANKALAREGR